MTIAALIVLVCAGCGGIQPASGTPSSGNGYHTFGAIVAVDFYERTAVVKVARELNSRR